MVKVFQYLEILKGKLAMLFRWKGWNTLTLLSITVTPANWCTFIWQKRADSTFLRVCYTALWQQKQKFKKSFVFQYVFSPPSLASGWELENWLNCLKKIYVVLLTVIQKLFNFCLPCLTILLNPNPTYIVLPLVLTLPIQNFYSRIIFESAGNYWEKILFGNLLIACK